MRWGNGEGESQGRGGELEGEAEGVRGVARREGEAGGGKQGVARLRGALSTQLPRLLAEGRRSCCAGWAAQCWAGWSARQVNPGNSLCSFSYLFCLLFLLLCFDLVKILSHFQNS